MGGDDCVCVGRFRTRGRARRFQPGRAKVMSRVTSGAVRPLIDPAASLALHLAAAPGSFALFLGSGASAPAVPTGRDVLLTTISRVYAVTEGHAPPESLDLLAWWRERYGEPTYGTILEAAFPVPEARRDHLAGFFANAKPTETHREAARLVRRGLVTVFVTTNFDHLLERALEDEGITPTVISLPEQLEHAPPRERSAAYVLKVHGDYTTGRIRNAPQEIEQLDAPIAAELSEIARRYGLIVVGYAGADPGVLRILQGSAFRAGLYWVARAEGSVPAELRDRVSVVTADDGATFLRDLQRRIEVLAAYPEGRLPGSEYREVRVLLHEADTTGVERRARVLGRRLRDTTTRTRDTNLAHPCGHS